jgi:CheY-like chemotaxis protein
MPRTGLHIAIVDDDLAVRRALRRVLLARSHQPTIFASGSEFLASLDDSLPDCVILDLRMPGMGGLEVQNELRQRSGPTLPAIIVTAHPDDESRRECLAAGVSGYLIKPIDIESLMHAITEAIEA